MYIKIQTICWGGICLDFNEADMNRTSLLRSNFAVEKISYSKAQEKASGKGDCS